MSKHEMQFLSMISKIGCDIVLVFTDKGQSYKKVDSNTDNTSKNSTELEKKEESNESNVNQLDNIRNNVLENINI